MPRLNARGQALMGRGSGPASVDGRIIIAPGGGPASWLNDDEIIVNTNATPPEPTDSTWNVLVVNVQTGVRRTMHVGGANALAAWEDRWIGWANGVGLFGSVGMKTGDVRGAGPGGTVAYCPNQQSGVGLILDSVEGSIEHVPGAVVFDEYALQVIGPRKAVWFDGAAVRAYGVPVPKPALKSGKLRRVEVDGEVWLVYQSERGLIAQVDGADEGYIIEARPITFNHDASAVGSSLVYAYSVTQGEGPNDCVKHPLDRTLPRVKLTNDIVVPKLNGPLWLAGFDFGNGTIPFPGNSVLQVVQGAPRLILKDKAGVPILAYVAGSPDGDMDAVDAAIKASKAIDNLPVAAYWTAKGQASGRLPNGCELVAVEGYCHVDETTTQFEVRFEQACALCWTTGQFIIEVAQGYTSNNNNTTDIALLVPAYARRAINNALIRGILLFNLGKRGSADVYGWDFHPEIHGPWADLASGIVGTPSYPSAHEATPIPPPLHPTPVPPIPPIPPIPPKPPSFFAGHKEHTIMNTQIVALRGPGGKFGRFDAPNTGPWGHLNQGWRGLVWDGDSPINDNYKFELSRPDTKHKLVNVSTRGLFGADPTNSHLAEQFYLKPDENDRGWGESPVVYEGNVSGVIAGWVEFDQDPSLGKFVSCGFAVEVLK